MKYRINFFSTTAIGFALLLSSTALGQGYRVQLQTRAPMSPKLSTPRAGVIPGGLAEIDGSGQIRRLWGKVRVGGRTPQEAAEKFLTRYSAPLGLSSDLSEIRLERKVTSLTGEHVIYRQTYGGLPVFGGEIGIHLDRTYNVVALNHDLQPISKNAGITLPQFPESAIASAHAVLPGFPDARYAPLTTPGVLVIGGNPTAVWKVNLHTISPSGSWDVYVDASTNQVISYRDILERASGTGLVFDPNPVATSGIANLVYDPNAPDARIDAQRISVTLQGLDSSGYLTGQYADTSLSTSITRAFSASHTYQYTYLDHRFDETMAYYQVDSIERYLLSLGFNNVENRQVKINVDGIPDDNSFYDPSNKTLTFGVGGVPDAQDADVVWHENGHAIQNDQVPGWGATHDALSIGEGWGDYWAFSHGAGKGPNRSWDPYVFKWDATAYNPGDPAFLRVVNSTKHYPENMDYVNFDVHADGEMWSACLYQLWNLLGKQKADTIILESNFYLSPSASFIDGAHAILKANAALYNGASYAAIRQIFVDRGFLDSQGIGAATPNYTISGTITGPSPSGVSVAASATATSPYVAGAEPGMDVPAGNTTGASFPINVPLNASITSVTLGVSVQSANGGHIEILVKGPDGTTVIVKDPNPTDNSTTNIVTSYPNLTPSAHPLTAFNTKNAKGTWTVQVLDPTSGDTDGLFNWFTLSLTFSSGTYQKTVASRSDGSYFLTQLPSATYTVTPSKTGTSYTPPTRAVPLTSNVSSQDFVQTQPKLTAFSVSSNTMLAGDSGLATLTLSSSIGANTAVQLASSNSALSVAPTCTISGGQTRGATSVTARAVSASTSVTLSAKLNDVTKTVTISVLPAPALRQLTLVSGVVHGGGTMGASVRLAGATPAPMRVTLASSDASVTLPAFVIVPAGASSVSFTVQTSMVRQQEQVGLSATRGSNVVGSILYVVP